MKTLIALSLSLFTVMASAQNKPTTAVPSVYKVNPAASKIEWTGKKITGAHNGTLTIKSGNIVVTNDLITAGEIVVDMNTITVSDIPAKEEGNGKLVGHLNSPDFFDVTKFPEAKLVIKSSKKVAKGLEVSGDLTVKGKTNPITFVTALTKNDKGIKLKSDLNVDRTKYDVKYGSGSFFKGLGDKAINDEFALNVEVAASL